MKRKPEIPAKRVPMPEGYDGIRLMKQQGSPALQCVGGVQMHDVEGKSLAALSMLVLGSMRSAVNYHALKEGDSLAP
jgi:hypothetical protein